MVVLAPARRRQDVRDGRGVHLKKLLQSSNITPISPTDPTAMATQERQGGLLEAEKVKTNASKPSEKPGVIRGLDNMKNK